MKRNKRILISKKLGQYDNDWPPEDAVGALAWFQAKLDEVPQESRRTARIEIDHEEYFGTNKATIVITYMRPETDEEQSQREKEEALMVEQHRED